MPTGSTSLVELFDHLGRLGIARGMNVVVHSRLLTFGSIERGADGVLEVLTERIGANGNLAVPTYTFQLGEKDVYGPSTAPAHQMGALAKAVIGRPGWRRGLCPIHNHTYFGTFPIDLGDPEWSVGPGSSFAHLQEADFQLLLLGCGLQLGGTYVHHVEAQVGVEYREWRLLPRRMAGTAGTIRNLQVNYYARQLGVESETVDFSRLEQSLISRGDLRRVPVKNGFSSIVSLKVLDATTRLGLSTNPRLLCK